MSPLPSMGSRSRRFDAPDKALGRERFAADEYPENLLWAGALRAGAPHGLVRGVDTARAEAMPGVVAVLTAGDVPGANRQGFIYWDMPVLCGDKVRHAGDPVALVVAETREILAEALLAIEPDIEPLPVVDGLDAALAPDAPRVHDLETGNVLKQATVRKGDARAALDRCDVVIEETFFTPQQAHCFLETENGTARMDAAGIIHMTVSTQSPFRDRYEVGQALGIPQERLHVIAPFLGGGFGGKDGVTVQCLLALAAMHAGGRPVKMWWSREESLLAGYKRHAARMRFRLGAGADGALRALVCDLDYDTGAYAHLGVEIMALGLEHASGPYRVETLEANGRCVYTNNPVAGAFRGFGVAQVSFAFEGMMDRLADRLGMDPLELRLQNAIRRGDRNGVGVAMTASTGMAECLAGLREHPLWRTRGAWVREAPPLTRRGVGVAAVLNGMGYGRGLADMAVAKVRLTVDGRFRIYNGVSDMGQGNSPTFVRMACHVLNQDESGMELVQPDTDRSHPSGSAAAGRTTYTYGKALIRACEAMRDKLLHRAAMALLVDDVADLELAPGAVRHPATGRALPLALLGSKLHPDDRCCVSEAMMPVTRDVPEGGEAFRLGFPHLIFPYAAHLARVEVDELTGRVAVADYVAFTDGGRVLDPQTYEQQVQGAVAQGLGYALWEDCAAEGGRLLATDLSTYVIPGAGDLPDIESHAVETVEESGPFGMKGIGEVGMNGPLPAVASALLRMGLPMTRAPFTPERILAALGGDDS
ncbi:xanthine dehydrogenase family protein molybdopterin-binding subunit [Pseudodesulfovibrio sp.]|uniref:xanthine dehydrogenase family protein molybdopterin-binding subunit n=1 Tax=Pseudodesulfovibrio sp. TaxID=2035812 RepID=UPI0026376CB1|nr:xanthine dehydrogenase family protein molybdopterin-binding subunit [Pseudodesulfovibrio sp.]MDD3311444.1 xanthine dehydrogenase family protein molybdopterin-binding subunit [Pseudodesulfovibrio sp.]